MTQCRKEEGGETKARPSITQRIEPPKNNLKMSISSQPQVIGGLSPDQRKTIKGFETPPENWNQESSDELQVEATTKEMERKLVRKVDLRLCTIAGILCSLNLLDSGIISSASVTSIFEDLGMGVGDRYVSSFLSCFLLFRVFGGIGWVVGFLGMNWRKDFADELFE